MGHQGIISRQFVILVFFFSLLSITFSSIFSLRQETALRKKLHEKTLTTIEENWLPLLTRAAWLLADEEIRLISMALVDREDIESLHLSIEGFPDYGIGTPPPHHGETYTWPLIQKYDGTMAEIGTLTITTHQPTFPELSREFLPRTLPREGLKIILILLPVFLLVQLAITRQLDRLTVQLADRKNRVPDDALKELTLDRRKLFRKRDELDQLVDAYNQLIREIRKERRVRIESEENLLASLKEKEILIREVHHRVKNNLQVVISLLHLQETDLESEQGQLVLQQAGRRMASLALVHEQLYSEDTVETIELRAYTQDLLNNLAFSMSDYGDNGVALSVRGDEVRVSLDQAIPLALIMNELCTNAFEHAFTDFSGGTIEVEIECRKDNFTVSLCDNGRGIPESFSIGTGEGFGLNLVASLAGQLEADLSCRRREGGGSCFFITAPLGGGLCASEEL
jgi:two-component sensor histidine kinase